MWYFSSGCSFILSLDQLFGRGLTLPSRGTFKKKVVCLYRTTHRRVEIFEGVGAGGGGGELSSPSSSSHDHQTPQGVGGVAVGAK